MEFTWIEGKAVGVQYTEEESNAITVARLLLERDQLERRVERVNARLAQILDPSGEFLTA